MGIADNLARVQEKMAQAAIKSGRDPKDITLVGATKTQNHETISTAISAGLEICGENRVQEMKANLEKNAYQGARLDFIGHLQSNKVKQVVGQVSLIHSVSSRHIMEEVSKNAQKQAITQDILLEINLAKEESKSGFIVDEMDEICHIACETSGINVKGFMAIPPVMENSVTQEKFFERLFQLYIDFSPKMTDNYREFNCLSMGMSDDYELAIKQGSTLVRVGTALFGPRQ